MATVIRCVDCPDRRFDNPGSARGHANRLGHHTVEIDEALTLQDEADAVVPETEGTSASPAPAFTGELGAELDQLAETVRTNYTAGQRAYKATWTAYRAIAEALAKARELLRDDGEYRRWVKEQAFPFSTTIEGEWRRIGERIEAADEFVDTSVAETGEVPGRRKILKAVVPPKPKPEPEDEPLDEDAVSTPDLSAEDLIRRFIYSEDASAFAEASLTDEEFWLEVPTDDRRAIAHEFKLLVDRFDAILEIWREG